MEHSRMLVKVVQLGSIQCVGRATLADSALRRGRTPFTEAHWGPPQRRLPTGAILWAKRRFESNVGRREAVPQVALYELSRPKSTGA
eukprot:14689648-Alexandrium_andersonii.AAC.1